MICFMSADVLQFDVCFSGIIFIDWSHGQLQCLLLYIYGRLDDFGRLISSYTSCKSTVIHTIGFVSTIGLKHLPSIP